MQFDRSATVTRLYVSSDPARQGTVMYLLPQSATSCPDSITFADSWSTYDGAYLFVNRPPADLNGFAQSAWQFLEDPRNAGTRFAWLETSDGLASGTGIAIYSPSTGTWATSFPVAFQLRNIGLSLVQRTPVTVDDAAFSFGFAQQGRDGIQVTAQWGGATAGIVTGAVTLPLSGGLAGCLQLPLQLAAADLDALDVGLRWFYAVPPEDGDRDEFFLASLRTPLLADGTTLYPNVDPLDPLDGDRTFLAFNASDAGQQQSGPAPAVPSWFNATMGDQFSLQPLAAVAFGSQPAAPQRFASLAFSVNQGASTASDSDALYLVPSGDFELTTRTGNVDLMCGLSGVEYFEPAGAATTSTISFVPGQESYARGFIPHEPPGATTLEPADVPTTSYATVTQQTGGVGYFAQPDQSVLYNYGDLAGSGSKPIVALAAQAVQAATITDPPADAPLFPMLPYAGTSGQEPQPLAQLESQVISPLRRAKIASSKAGQRRPVPLAALGDGPSSVYSATPQGLLAQFGSVANQWAQIVLANMPALTNQLMFQTVDGELLSAFQSNKLFLVASNATAMAPYLKPGFDQIAIGANASSSWVFDLGTDEWATYHTVLIVKFSDQSIQELAANTAGWASPQTFNTDPAATGTQILKAIENAPANDPDFAAFIEAMTSPTWNGIVALNVRAPLAELPTELAGLAAGIDPGQFFAHHVAIEASKITVASNGGQLGIESSSIFGLIYYQGPAPRANGAPYAFAVRQLKVLFLNSAVASFSSVIDLEIDALFGEPAELQPAGSGNVVELFGVYQRQASSDGTPQGSYVFQTKSGESSVFAVKSAVLDTVVLSKGQFVTVTAESTATFTDSKFVFWGLIDFAQLDVDVFSFGREKGAPAPAGLSFGNLAIGMTFDPQSAAIAPAFAFDSSQLSLDVATSKPRKDSLFEHFPLTVRSFKQGDAGAGPTDLGYMGLETLLSQSTLSYPWFSLEFDLDLGSAGALASEAGFVASLITAWSPSTPTAYKVFTGLKLPGSSGSKRQISIEGLFNITFKAIELLTPAPDAYVLVLYGIGFKFLSLTFPPSGQVNFTLFGDPSSGGAGTSLGWYAAYAKDSAQGGKKPRLAAPRPPGLPRGRA